MGSHLTVVFAMNVLTISTWSLNDNGNAIFQDKIEMLNNDKSIIGTRLHNLQKEIQCPFCEYRPVNSCNIKRHVANVHQGLKYDCTNCDYQSGDKSNLRRHIEKSHLGVTYTCELCQHVWNSKQLLKSHVDVKHNGLLFKCDNCQFKSARKSNLENHILVQHNGVAFDCSIWQHKNNRKQGLVNHIKKTHEGLRYECHECDGVFTSKLVWDSMWKECTRELNMTMMVKSNLGQTREMEMSHCGKEGKNRILFSTCTLNYQITLSPATPKGANVGAVNVFVDSLQFVCQNGQVLIADLMNG